MSKTNVNEKGIVLPNTTESKVEKEMEVAKKKEISARKAEIEEARVVAQKIAVEGNFVELMEKYNIPTLVSIAKVINVAPQQLYSRRKKNKETGVYDIGDNVERAVLRAALQNTDMVTIEEIMQAARAYLDEKEAMRATKATTKKSKPKKKDQSQVEFKIGDKVEYDTFKAANGVREYYTRKGEIVALLSDGYKVKIKTDDGAEVDITCQKLRLQDLKDTTEA